jgi:hypothetical protein
VSVQQASDPGAAAPERAGDPGAKPSSFGAETTKGAAPMRFWRIVDEKIRHDVRSDIAQVTSRCTDERSHVVSGSSGLLATCGSG